ncbi:hypothetical protein ACQP2K_31930 [Microbispora siamensis]
MTVLLRGVLSLPVQIRAATIPLGGAERGETERDRRVHRVGAAQRPACRDQDAGQPEHEPGHDGRHAPSL